MRAGRLVPCILLAAGLLAACGGEDPPSPQVGLDLCETYDSTAMDQRQDELDAVYPRKERHTAAQDLAFTAGAARTCDFGPDKVSKMTRYLPVVLAEPVENLPEQTISTPQEPDPAYAAYPRLLPEFFEIDLKPTGLYAAWANAGRPDEKLTGAWPEDTRALQMLIGHALAEVTDPSRAGVVSPVFVAELHRLGTEQIRPKRLLSADGENGWIGSAEYGWTILTPLLRFGDFDASFLAPLAVDIIRFDQAHGGDWAVPGEPAHLSYDPFAPDATTGMPALLEALSRNRTALEQTSAQVPDPRLDALLAAG